VYYLVTPTDPLADRTLEGNGQTYLRFEKAKQLIPYY
jgi:hypothetical protein